MLELSIQKELLGVDGLLLLDVCLKIKDGEFVALCGDSGAGKTSLLRIISGLLKAKGKIIVKGVVFQDENTFLPPQKRRIGYSFQDYALFANLSVIKNLLYVNDDKVLAQKLLALMDLSKLKNRLTTQLSGGQKQRVALARAMMNKPRILLLDEPLSALDSSLRSRLQEDIKKLHTDFGTTTILVSHDEDEILKLASRKIVLKGGKIVDDYPLSRYKNQSLRVNISKLNEHELQLDIPKQSLIIRKNHDGLKGEQKIDITSLNLV